ncbi:hypothetical protein DCS32_15870 [Dokdonia sp. Dokd-P16]|uniref:RsiV family protein n=1 Tax=Dokdonia sp. Dokd-P16 TaxID=2173169 RepID=UPI000D54857B|nr:RsiV family protein [Dokdonia sp. Dokd-P16]AWH75584.1 hypothetical protein DCS32_15870 [Dokdonia sp. Dokd-P16]
MKIYLVVITLLFISGCKEPTDKLKKTPLNTESQKEAGLLDPDSADSLYLTDKDIMEIQAKSQLSKKEALIKIPDDRTILKAVVESKKLYKEADDYLLDYTYPYLNETVNPKYKAFNEYMAESYSNVERTVNEILEDKELLCDTLSIKRFRDKRIIDFKLHANERNLVSILLYKENYYSGMLHSTYMFDCLNYNVDKEEFIYFDDFFIAGAEKKVFDLINQTIYDQIHSGEMFYDCWEISDTDFKAYKNNFVINDNAIEFYFDDCIICPSYTGQYSVVIPLIEIMHLIERYQQPLLLASR